MFYKLLLCIVAVMAQIPSASPTISSTTINSSVIPTITSVTTTSQPVLNTGITATINENTMTYSYTGQKLITIASQAKALPTNRASGKGLLFGAVVAVFANGL